MSDKDLTRITKAYYDSEEADAFYYHIWGGEDIHIGIYEYPGQSIREASRNTVRMMAEMLPGLDESHHVLDLGAGYGGSARELVRTYSCRVDCLNLSEKENARNRRKTHAAGLDDRIRVYAGNFEDLPFQDASYDLVWSQDAFLHSNRKGKIIREASRVLRPGGHLIFTDPMQKDDCPRGVLEPVLDRIHLEEMGSVPRYRKLAREAGLEEVRIERMPEQLVNHYAAVLSALEAHYEDLREHSGEAYLQKMKTGLHHWIEAGKRGDLDWGVMWFSKM